jgi:hypothetical protein
MKRLIPLFVCAVLVALLVAESGFAEAVVVSGLQSQPAKKDTRDYTNTAMTDSSMWNENTVQSETKLRGRNSATDAWQTWLQFDLSGVWATHDIADLQSATLSMMITNMGTSTRKRVYVSGMLDGLFYEDEFGNPTSSYEDWSELTLTWNNAPANDIASTGTPIWSQVYGGGYISDSTYLGGPTEGWTTTGVDDGIATAVELMTAFIATDTDGKVTFILSGHDTTYAYGVGDELGNGPYLTLTFIPEPATLAILGLGGLLLRRRIA